jgi:hypothetical protein
MDVAGTFKLIGNTYTRLSRMQLGEMQNECRDADVEVAYNVIDGVVDWYNDTFVASYPAWGVAKLDLHHNYARCLPLTDHGQMGNGIPPRLGIGFETAGKGEIRVHDNVIGSPVPFFNYVASASIAPTVCANNVLYGTITEAALFEPEPKVGGGNGLLQIEPNNRQLPFTQMPQPAAFIAAIGHGIGPNAATQPTAMKLEYSWPPTTGANGGGAVIVSVSGLPPGTAEVKINSRATGDHGLSDVPLIAPTPANAVVVGGVATCIVQNIHPGWQVDFIATAFDGLHRIITTSDWVTTPNFPKLPDGTVPSTWPPQVVDPPPPPPPPLDYDLVTTTTTKVRAGKPSGPPVATQTTQPVR